MTAPHLLHILRMKRKATGEKRYQPVIQPAMGRPRRTLRNFTTRREAEQYGQRILARLNAQKLVSA